VLGGLKKISLDADVFIVSTTRFTRVYHDCLTSNVQSGLFQSFLCQVVRQFA
jgi:hypothetical protein